MHIDKFSLNSKDPNPFTDSGAKSALKAMKDELASNPEATTVELIYAAGVELKLKDKGALGEVCLVWLSGMAYALSNDESGGEQ